MTTTYAVTGGAGFIGSHIASHLLKEGNKVHVIDNLLTGRQSNLDYLETLDADLTIHKTSILDLDDLKSIFDGVEVVFHQAALPSVPRSVEDPIGTNQHCVNGTLNVLVAARDAGVRRVVYAASSSAYGDVDSDYKSETFSPNPISPYAVAKLTGEYYCQVFNHVYELETVALRYFNVFGPRQDPTSHYAAVIPKFITMMLDSKNPTIYGDGLQSRDFTYIDNVVHGNILASTAEKAKGEVMNLAVGDQITLNTLVDKLNAILGTNIPAEHTEPRAGDIMHSRADIEKAGELLGYEPIVTFDDGLARTVSWYQNKN